MNRKWVPNEDYIILNEMYRHKTKKACFMAAAEKLGREPDAVSTRYYRHIKGNPQLMIPFDDGDYNIVIEDKEPLYKRILKWITEKLLRKKS